MVEFEPAAFKKILLSAGLAEAQAREIEMEFSRLEFVLDDSALLDALLRVGADTFAIISVFGRIGIGGDSVVGMMEARERDKLGHLADIHALEIEDAVDAVEAEKNESDEPEKADRVEVSKKPQRRENP